jgi:hypothetical protein
MENKDIPDTAVSISLDTTDVDKAIKKVEKLNELLKESRKLLCDLGTINA